MEINFPKTEKETLKFWKENRIFEKSILKRKKAPNFVFYEGPPTANGKPGIHHVLSRVFKDIICRYKTMQGFRVLRKAGWDTHGLPVELEIEKKIAGLKNKKDIEKFGIAKFNKLCQKSVWNYKKDWEKLTERIAFWLDTKNPYITYETNYIETVWWIIKEIWQSGLIYKGHKVVPYCPRCGTVLSSHEVALGYESIKENSVYLRFRVIAKDSEWQNTSILSWTTTPWTLPGNVALAINPDIDYICVPDPYQKNHWLVLALQSFKALLKKEIFSPEFRLKFNLPQKQWKNIDIFKGSEMLGIQYQPLFNILQLKTDNSYKVYPADFVTAQDGTGVVHTAVMYGEDDYNLGKKADLPTFHTVTEEGKFIKALEEGLADLYVKSEKAEFLILEHLKKNNLLFAQELYEHDYPFCWRCDSPLLYYAKESWFIDMQKVKNDLIDGNKKINWIPAHLKNGRFGEWLKEVKDWAFSRERYWGTPLPIWHCQKCGNLEVIGSKKDLIFQTFSHNKYFILRHGESLRNIKDLVVNWPEKIHCPLTEKGKKQIKAVAHRFKKERIDLIFSSDLSRTKQTAEIIGKEISAKIQFDKRIREIDLGELNGKKTSQAGRFWDPEKKLKLLDYYLKRFTVRPPAGENYLDVKKRMYNFLKDIEKKYQNKRILIVSHELPLTMLEASLKGLSPTETIKFREKSQLKTGQFRKLEFKLLPYDNKGELDFHRPYIDEVKFYCQKCEGIMERTPEVIDCWFDSGSMPFAQHHFPFDPDSISSQSSGNYGARNKKSSIQLPKNFPADFISEAIDQTRGWFYTLHAISVLLGKGPSYKNVICLGHVLDEKGEKMSKSKGNIIDPWYIVDKYGTDAVRWYFYTVNQPGDAKLFSEGDVEQALKKFILTLRNCYTFLETYVPKKEFPITNVRRRLRPLLSLRSATAELSFQFPKRKKILDKWIISKLNNLIQEETRKLDNYDVTGAARAIESFVVEDISLWYIRRSRRRFQKPETKKELEEASETLGFVLLTLSKIISPFIPFLSEEIYQRITNNKKQIARSIHLEDWPKTNKKLIDKKLEEKMTKVREIVARALTERAKKGIKVRQPLNGLQITNHELRREKELLGLIKSEVNVKEITFGKTLKLDAKITPQLKEEGIIREIVRNIQEMRKKAALKPKDEILVRCSGNFDLNKIITKNKNFILKEAKVKDLISGEKVKEIFSAEKEMKIDQQNLWIGIKKL